VANTNAASPPNDADCPIPLDGERRAADTARAVRSSTVRGGRTTSDHLRALPDWWLYTAL